MNTRALGRTLSAALSLVALGLLLSASAQAAGKPSVASVSPWSQGLTAEAFTSSLNPNGAETTVTFEYGKAASFPEFTTQPVKVGAGTTYQWVNSSVFNGFAPRTEYKVRVNATNSFGTTSLSKTYSSGHWELLHSTTAPFEASKGTWKLTFKYGGTSDRIECAESGFGTIGNNEAKGDGYHLTASNCAFYEGEKKVCQPESFGYTLDGAFKSETNGIYIVLCPGVSMPIPLTFTEPLKFTATTLLQVEKPVTLSGNVQFLGTTAQLTSSSTWALSAPYSGEKFGFEW